jgi:HK97 family phage prohead protease
MEYKIYAGKVKEAPGGNPRVLRFVASTEQKDRQGDVVVCSGWDLTPYQKNPVVLWAHNYDQPPVGKTVNAFKDLRTGQLILDVQFMSAEELAQVQNPSEAVKFAESIYQMYKLGYLSAVSVGFQAKKVESFDDADPNIPAWAQGHKITEAELFELSCVPVPANADALVLARGMKSIDKGVLSQVEELYREEKVAIPFKHYALAEEDQAWDGPKVVADSDVEDLEKICAWKADKKPEDMTKGDFKLPHHLAKADGYKTVKKGVVAAVGVLFGARGGADIPEADIEGVKAHLKKHYAEFELDWPEEKAAWDIQAKAVGIEEEHKDVEPDHQKEGRRLSADTMSRIDDLESGIKEMDEAIAALQKCRDGFVKRIASLRDGAGAEEPEPDEMDDGDIEIEPDESVIDVVD